MCLQCTICGSWYPRVGWGHLEMCEPCYSANFSGAQPPLDIHTPLAREALEAYVSSANQLTPRQRAAMAHMQAQWRRQVEDDL